MFLLGSCRGETFLQAARAFLSFQVCLNAKHFVFLLGLLFTPHAV